MMVSTVKRVREIVVGKTLIELKKNILADIESRAENFIIILQHFPRDKQGMLRNVHSIPASFIFSMRSIMDEPESVIKRTVSFELFCSKAIGVTIRALTERHDDIFNYGGFAREAIRLPLIRLDYADQGYKYDVEWVSVERYDEVRAFEKGGQFNEANGKLVRKSKSGGIDWYRYSEDILKRKLIPFAEAHDLIAMEDGAVPHVHKECQKVYNLSLVRKLLWPGNSPDLNMIEPCWYWMKRSTSLHKDFESRPKLREIWVEQREKLQQRKPGINRAHYSSTVFE